ncbi:ATP-dependent Clp protease ATP-binding subunit [Candidatus Parcubacteria bacterium]|nr:ATP-dependent Clp protease ATP-binding subunit [Candidatus Parcubacteria bacterium]
MAVKFSFDLKNTAIFQAVKWGNHPAFRFISFFKTVFLLLFVIFFGFFLYGFIPNKFPAELCSRLLGLSLILFVFYIGFCLKESFFNSKFKKPKLKIKISDAIKNHGNHNLAEFLSYETAKAVWKSQSNPNSVAHNLLVYNPELSFVFSRALLNLNKIKKTLKAQIGRELLSANFQNIILEALKIADKNQHQRIEIGDMLSALAKQNLIFKKILIKAKIKAQDIENLCLWLQRQKEKMREKKKFWEWKNLIKKGSLAKAWASGYTIVLDKYSNDLSKIVKQQGFPEIVGRKKEIKAIERILSKQRINNVMLIGEPGTGRKSIISALAKRSLLGESSARVNFKRVVQLDLPKILAQTKSREEIESILDTIFKEAVEAGNVILVIDNFHNFVDISGILGSYLRSPKFQIVAITTFSGLHKYIEEKQGILAMFEKVEVSETSEKETLMILQNLCIGFEQKYKKFISFPALRDIINLSLCYEPTVPFPKKAIDLLDGVMAYVSQTKDKIVLPKHIAEIVSEKTEIPVGEVRAEEKEILLNLENLIHQRIINQEKAVREVSTALRRARAGISGKKATMGNFLFLGPTGVGKTETSKVLTNIYFGSKAKMIRLDMSEFQAIKDIPRLIGSPGQEGLLTTLVKENPFSLILLDEIEKAHPNILNLFLQVLDEGHLTDGLGRKVIFRNTIIIATSNAGYKIILEALKQKTEWSNVKQKLLDFLFEKAIFRPEFINRFDAVIVFRPLTKENLLDIAQLMLEKLKKNLKQKDIEFIITEQVKEKISELGYNPVFGARAMKRVIQDKIENVLAKAILSGELKRGDRVEINPEFKLIINH